MITVFFVNGQKLITERADMVYYVNEHTELPTLKQHYLVNWQNVTYIRESTKDEIEFAKYHGEA